MGMVTSGLGWEAESGLMSEGVGKSQTWSDTLEM